jgi:acetylornithine/succinyldiaminopimelate/putrescine aminotransferase
MGRTGSLWAYEQTEVVPDAMTVAKGLGGGLAIGALVIGPRLSEVFEPGDHGSTFAGGPLIASAANAVLDVVTADGFLEQVAAKGDRLLAGLRDAGLDGVRGRGLMVAFETGDAPARARQLLLDQRLVVNATGPTTIRLLPPLTVSDQEIDVALERLRA